MASGRFMEELMREHEQSLLLQATCGDLYDHIDDLLDFPMEDSAADVLLLDAPAPPGSPISARIIDFARRSPAPAAALPPPPPPPPPPPQQQQQAGAAFMSQMFDGGEAIAHIGSCDDELEMDMQQLELLSELFDDASIPQEPAFFPGSDCGTPIRASALGANAGVVLPDKLEDALFCSSSPTSVLEDSGFNVATGNSSSCKNNGGSSSASSASSSSASSSSESFSGSGGGRAEWSLPVSPRPEPPVLVVPARARSKRSRMSAFSAVRAAAHAAEPTILVPTPMFSSTSPHSDPESFAESDSLPAPPPKKKKKAKKAATSDAEGDADADADADYEDGGGPALPPGAVRRCTHCQIEKTPQWRAGPLGPKTLCNACGVRYKSGRLFPEYRPAASPTFVPSIHSNSHKKVVEMRQKVAPKGDDLLQFIRRRD